MKRLGILLLMALTVLVSCSKDDDNKPSVDQSRTLKYEVTGNFTGTLFASYTTASGGTANDAITIPWNREITFASGVAAANIVLSGNGGTAGQQATVVIKRGGANVSTTTATADASGGFSKAAPVVVF